MPSTALVCQICRMFRSTRNGDYFVRTQCTGEGHVFHRRCIQDHITRDGKKSRCPTCKKPVSMGVLIKMTNVSIVHVGPRRPSTMKIATLGSSEVGKSSLVRRYQHGTFSSTDTLSTIGCDVAIMPVTICDRIVILRIWDTAGQERFYSIMPSYLREVDAVLLVYDITSRKSFNEITKWDRESEIMGSWRHVIEQFAPPGVLVFLCGNKSDCADKRQVTREEGQALARRMEIGFLEASAKDDQNVDAVFKLLATVTLDKLVEWILWGKNPPTFTEESLAEKNYLTLRKWRKF